MSRNIIYLRGRSEEHSELVRALEERRFSVVIVRNVEEACQRAMKIAPLAAIIDASSNEAEVSERLIDISDAAALFPLPVLFFGKRASEHTHPVTQKFPRFIPVDYPFRLDEVLSRFGLETEGGADGEALGPRVVENYSPLNKLDPANLRATRGGEVLLEASSREDFDDEVLVPAHPEREKLISALDALSDKNEWLAVHARRTAFVASAVANALECSEEEDSAIRVSALMLNWGLADPSGRALKLDLLATHSIDIRRRISDGIKVSAELAAKRLGDPKSAATLEAVAELILNPGSEIDPAVRRAAECVLITEATDRACWKSGRWDYLGAHRSLRLLRTSPLITDHDLSASMGRVLGEAVLSQDPGNRMFNKALTNEERVNKRKEFDQAREEAQTLFRNASVKKINVFELSPGMRLAEPLTSIDGQVILPANTLIDFDIVLRVMQLAAVRPINSPITVVR